MALATGVLLVILAAAVVLSIEPGTRSGWLRRQERRLRNPAITDRMVAGARRWGDFDGYGVAEQCCYYRLEAEGIIPLGDGSWVYAAFHSLHAGNVLQLLMGARYDAILAMDSKGQFYTNDGHVCGALALKSEHPVFTLEDFLRTVTMPCGEGTWRKQDVEPTSPMHRTAERSR